MANKWMHNTRRDVARLGLATGIAYCIDGDGYICPTPTAEEDVALLNALSNEFTCESSGSIEPATAPPSKSVEKESESREEDPSPPSSPKPKSSKKSTKKKKTSSKKK